MLDYEADFDGCRKLRKNEKNITFFEISENNFTNLIKRLVLRTF